MGRVPWYPFNGMLEIIKPVYQPGVIFVPQGIFDNFSRHFWSSQLGGCSWNLAEREQRCCETSYYTQDSPPLWKLVWPKMRLRKSGQVSVKCWGWLNYMKASPSLEGHTKLIKVTILYVVHDQSLPSTSTPNHKNKELKALTSILLKLISGAVTSHQPHCGGGGGLLLGIL